jgi:protocatechuate 3,4-dioxygenase beta subunit
LRGYQVTDADGGCEFLTIYPGWYQGRTVHIHFKIRTELNASPSFEFTSQLFFDDSFTDQVYLKQPYLAKGIRSTRNNNDGIYQQGGSQLMLAVQPSGDGYAATFDIGLQGVPAIPTATATEGPRETSTPTGLPSLTPTPTPEALVTETPTATGEPTKRHVYLPWATTKR